MACFAQSIIFRFGFAAVLTLTAQPVFAQFKWHGPDPVVGVGSTEPPAAASGGPHGIDIVLTGLNGHLYWQWLKSAGAYTDPVDLNLVNSTSGPSLVANGRNKLDAFYRGSNKHLWTSWWDGTWWSAPTDLGGLSLGSAPVAARGGPHRVDVFYSDSAGQLWNSYWDGGQWWSAPGKFGAGILVKGPVAVVTTGPHLVEVFYRSMNDRLWHFWSDGGPWSAPESLRTVITSNPSGASFLNPSGNRASVFYRNNSSILCVQESYKRGPWVSECSGIPVSDKLAAITVDEVFVMGQSTPVGNSPRATMRVWRD